MFVVLLKYTKPLAEIDRLMREHVTFLEEGFGDGVFLAAGRQVPRTGGVIVSTGESKEELDERMRRDPFVVADAATYEIVEFRTSFHHPHLAPFADPRTRAVRDVPEL